MVCNICRRGGKKCNRYIMKGKRMDTKMPAERMVYLCSTCMKDKDPMAPSILHALRERTGIVPEELEKYE